MERVNNPGGVGIKFDMSVTCPVLLPPSLHNIWWHSIRCAAKFILNPLSYVLYEVRGEYARLTAQVHSLAPAYAPKEGRGFSLKRLPHDILRVLEVKEQFFIQLFIVILKMPTKY